MDKKKIGILTHFKANNFGANLQALSTASYLKNKGYIPVFINWSDYLSSSISHTPCAQVKIHQTFIEQQYECSSECFSDNDIVKVIKDNNIQNIIVGSDAVLAVSSFIQYFRPTNKGVKYSVPSKDHIFPNPFWLSFSSHTNMAINFFLMSASSQSSAYRLFSYRQKQQMRKQLSLFSYLSARDNWTKKMIQYLNPTVNTLPITSDPVFSFNQNVRNTQTKKDILEKYKLPENYIVVSFYSGLEPSTSWLLKFKEIAKNNFLSCVALPMPQGTKINCFDYSIPLPISPIDWYDIIRFSSGYVGNNMHPIIVCLHNSVPFYSIDQHGLKILKYIYFPKLSKTHELLETAGLVDNWIPINRLSSINCNHLVEKLKAFDYEKCSDFAQTQYEKYNEMMNDIVTLFK
jgi:hypothetical protein